VSAFTAIFFAPRAASVGISAAHKDADCCVGKGHVWTLQ
jgi:hypothetical protein